MMLARPLQRLCGLLLALGVAMAPVTVPAQDLDPQVVTPEEREELERLLAHLGFIPGPIDGVIDDKSRTAIRGYQDFAALPVDGEPSAALLAELRGLVQLIAELDAQQPELDAPNHPEPSVAPVEPPAPETPITQPPIAEPLPQVPTDSNDLEEPATKAAAPEPGGDGGTEAQTAPEPAPSVAEAAQPAPHEPETEATPPATETPPASLDTEAARTMTKPPPAPRKPATLDTKTARTVTKPPPAPRKPALAPTGPAEPSAPAATELAGDPAPAEAGPSTATPQEPPRPPAPAKTLLEQIVAAIDNPPARPSQPPAPAPETPSGAVAPESPAPRTEPDPAPNSDPYQAALAPFLPLLAAGRMSEEDLAQTFNDRGKVQFVKGFYDQAIADYGLAIHVKPNFAEAHHNRGVAYEALGDFVQAKTDFRAAKRLGFNRPGAL